MLKIKEITIHNIALPLQETIRMSKVIIEKSNSILVKVQSTDDISGWGEAASSLSMTGESSAGMILALEYIKNQIKKELKDIYLPKKDISKLLKFDIKVSIDQAIKKSFNYYKKLSKVF